MIGFKSKRKRANSRRQRVKMEASQKYRFRDWTIGKDVQAYLPNRLVVLAFQEPVLSDKVKAIAVSCTIS